MTAARILTICVGISAYRPDVLDPGERPLQFLADSARDLSKHFASMWPGRESKHLLIVDDVATLPNIGSLIAEQADPYDMFILYMGGHARTDNNPFEFLFFDEKKVNASGSSKVIDAIVAMPKAGNIILFLDACNSGTYGEETAFFRSEVAGGMRICIASSLKNQKSWEDPRSGRSLFSDSIIKAFTAENSLNLRTRHDIDKLYNKIASDVARHAYAMKGGIAQQPVLISSSDAAPSLPVARNRAKNKRWMTTHEILSQRSLLIALASICIGAILLASFSIVTWRPAINDSGYIELRPGPKWLSFLNYGSWRLRVETEATSADLIYETIAPGNGSFLLNEKGIHAWPGINTAQVRRWADVFVDEYLNAEAGARWRVRLGYKDAGKHLITGTRPGDSGSVRIPNVQAVHAVAVDTAAELAAEARILDPTQPLAEAWRLQWHKNVATCNCIGADLSEDAVHQLDIYLHHSEPDKFADWLRGLALTARVDDAVGIEEVAQLVEMFTAANTIWRREHLATTAGPGKPVTATSGASRLVERPTIREVASLAGIASAIVARRIATSQESVTSAERARLLGTLNGCADVAAPVLATLGYDGDPGRVIAWAHARTASEQVRLSLRELAAHGALPGSEIAWVLDALGFSGDLGDRQRAFDNAREWLIAVSDVMPLPPDILARLVSYATDCLLADDVEATRQALSVIARSPYAVQPPLGGQVNKLIAGVMPPRIAGKMPSKNVLLINQRDLELLGLLARSGATLTYAQRKMIINVVERRDFKGIPRVSFSENDKGESQHIAQLAAGVNSVHLLAFSRFIIGAKADDMTSVDKRTLNFLQQALADSIRFGVPLERMREVLAATAMVRKKNSKDDLDAADIRNNLRRLATDAAARGAEAELATAALLLMPQPQSDLVVDNLRKYWRGEQEPETKLALAEIIINVAANW